MLHGASLAGATGLTQKQLDGAIGDARTVLPVDTESGEPLSIRSCWNEPPETLERTLALFPEHSWEDRRAEWLCNGREPEIYWSPPPPFAP